MRYLFLLLSCIFTVPLCAWAQTAANYTDAKGEKQGHWHINQPAKYGEPGYQEDGVYRNGLKEGTWIIQSTMGDTLGVEQYRYGYKNGISKYYNLEGLIREESWLAHNPENAYDTIPVYDLNDPDKVEMKAIKMEGSTVKHGYWRYYDPSTGMITKTERYVLGELVNDAPIPNKKKDKIAGLPDDTQNGKAKAIPKQVLDYEKQNSKKKIKVRTGETGL